MPVQNTFTLIPERCATPNAIASARPMTSKQIKKAHKAANKAPKLSRQEQRKLELAEQERIRKELEKERTAARARNARERKKAKEDAKREEKKRAGKPLVDVRPSQDLIARFVRGNGSGKKRDGQGVQVQGPPFLREDMPTKPIIPMPEESSAENEQRKTDDDTGNGLLAVGEQSEPGQPLRGDEQPGEDLEEVMRRDGSNVQLQEGGVQPLESFEIESINEPSRDSLETTFTENPTEPCQEINKAQAPPPPRPPVGSAAGIEKVDNIDEIEDDIFLDTIKDIEAQQSEHTESPGLQDSHPLKASQELLLDDLEDDMLELLGAVCDQQPPASHLPMPRPSPFRSNGAIPAGREFSSFAEEDLDEDLLQQLDGTVDVEVTAFAVQMKQHEPLPVKSAYSEASDRKPQLSFLSPRDIPSKRSSPPRFQAPPMSTQAVLLNFDDFFPSPSQQELELEGETSPIIPQLTPCPPPKKTQAAASKQPSPVESIQPTPPQKRFFSASGSNELLSLALHRSRRTAALEGLHEDERQRREAGMIEAAQEDTRPHSSVRPSIPMGPPASKIIQSTRKDSGVRSQRPALQMMPKNTIESPAHNQRRPSAPKTTTPTNNNMPQPPSKSSLAEISAGKENDVPAEAAPFGSQETEYGGDWVDELAHDLMT